MFRTVRTWVARVADRGALPSDSQEERLQKSVLAYTAILISVLALWWVVMYWILGVPRAAAIPFVYQIASVAGLTYSGRTGNFELFRRTQLLLMLVLPVALQWTLGGFMNSSAVIVWAFFSPLGALLSRGPRASGRWFAAYVALIVLSALVDPLLAPSAPELPGWFIVTNFLMNIGAVSLVVYVVLRYLSIKREEAVEALRREQDLVAWLNDLFSTFDLLSERHGLEKMKTVGDAYMAVAGLPTPRPDHATAAAETALAMQDVVARRSTPNGGSLGCGSGCTADRWSPVSSAPASSSTISGETR